MKRLILNILVTLGRFCETAKWYNQAARTYEILKFETAAVSSKWIAVIHLKNTTWTFEAFREMVATTICFSWRVLELFSHLFYEKSFFILFHRK